MLSTNRIELSSVNFDDGPHSEISSRPGGAIVETNLCAYNQTRECFLGLEIPGADFSAARLAEHLNAMTLTSGEGLWLVPFRGLPDSAPHTALDLIYLDEDCLVIDLVESFPRFHASPSSPRAASVLALPAHSIYSSQTQAGDQLVLCTADEMEEKLAVLASPDDTAAKANGTTAGGVIQNAMLLREKPLWSGGPGLLELEDRSLEDRPRVGKPHVMSLVQPGMKTAIPPKTWLERWWSPDPRSAPREAVSGLAAYYWTGGLAEPRAIRDISATGMYLVTEERWYPGTLVLMTLQRTEEGEQAAERAIRVRSKAVRWGNDGVGLQFVLSKNLNSLDRIDWAVMAADCKALNRFLERLGKSER